MARCTAPVRGHTRGGGADCPVHGNRYRGFGGGYSYTPSYVPTSSASSSSSGGGGGRSGSGRTQRARWSRAGSSELYTPAEIRTLTPVRESIEKRPPLPDPRDVFLCHAWDDRGDVAKTLNDLLVARGVSVWFSENDVFLGTSLLREIDKGLAKSRVGIVLVTPNLLRRLEKAGIADRELSVLLARDLLVPIVHNTTFDALRDVSPMLASRSGLDSAEEPMPDIAAKIAELVAPAS